VIVLVVIILGIGFIIFVLRMNRYSKRPEYLRGKKIDKYTDLITQKEVYIATSKDPHTKQFIHEAYSLLWRGGFAYGTAISSRKVSSGRTRGKKPNY
jgi:hypothetical protein